jgi:hypothetical protein
MRCITPRDAPKQAAASQQQSVAAASRPHQARDDAAAATARMRIQPAWLPLRKTCACGARLQILHCQAADGVQHANGCDAAAWLLHGCYCIALLHRCCHIAAF